MVQNLNQFKKAIAAGTCFEIVEHYFHPQYKGQIRKPNVIQTNGFYSVDRDDPNAPASLANYGKGVRFEYRSAREYVFDGDLIHVFREWQTWRDGQRVKELSPVMDIRLLAN